MTHHRSEHFLGERGQGDGSVLRATAAWTVARFDVRSERGATAVEYAIFIGVIAAVMIVAVIFLGKETYKNFQCPTSRGCGP